MKCLLRDLLIVSLAILMSCRANDFSDTQSKYPGFATFVDGYFHRYYAYPTSLETLLIEMESRSAFIDTSFMSIYETTLNGLKEDKKKITWSLSDEDFMNEHLLVMKGEDTLLYRVNTDRFPCLGIIMEGFKYHYLDYPNSLEALSEYVKMIGYIEEPPFIGCDSVTMLNLIECQNRGIVNWTKEENGILIMVNNDTVGLFPSFSPCESSPFDKRHIHFFDINKNVVLADQMEAAFKRGIYSIQMDFPVVLEKEKGNYHIMQYQNGCGVKLYCENDYLPQDSGWLAAINSFVSQFAVENNLGEIIFGVVYCGKK